MKQIVIDKLEEMHFTYLKKILGFKKHHLRDNLYEISLIKPIALWADYLLFITIRKILTKTTHDIEIINTLYQNLIDKYEIQAAIDQHG